MLTSCLVDFLLTPGDSEYREELAAEVIATMLWTLPKSYLHPKGDLWPLKALNSHTPARRGGCS